MKLSLDPSKIQSIAQTVTRVQNEFYSAYPLETAKRQPIHTVYGGAHLFSATTAEKMGQIAMKAFQQNAPTAGSLETIFGLSPSVGKAIHPRIVTKLEKEAVEDYRVDFEDGYGNRSDEDEDGHAERAALAMAEAMKTGKLPPFSGIRIKSFSEELFLRSTRTLDLFLTTLLDATQGRLPDNFVVTLPKVISPEQITALVSVLNHFEMKALLPAGVLRLEFMVETPQALFNRQGQCSLPYLLKACEGRGVAAHFGAYDYTAALNIAASAQRLSHSACDFARQLMQNTLAGTGIFLSDGATTMMPVGDAVPAAWQTSFRDIRHSLDQGFYQGWDLHPAQIPARYVALYSFFHEGLTDATERLKSFVEKTAQANLVNDTFDDAATGQGLLNFFLRGISCGALSESESEKTGLRLDEIRSRSFLRILNSRRKTD